LVAGTIKTALLLASSPGPAAGVVSTQVATLTEGVLKTMLLAKLKIVSALVLAMSVVTGAGLLAHTALAQKPAPSSTGQAVLPVLEEKPAQPQTKEFITVNGRVLGPDGQPLAGARLYLPHWLKQPPQGQDGSAMIQRGTTGQDGRFTLQLPRSDVRPSEAAQPAVLIAAAEGFGIDWVELSEEGAPGEVSFHMVKDVPIRGRILSTEGKPIVGVTLNVGAVMVPGKLGDFLKKALQGEWSAAETMMTKDLLLPVTKLLRVTGSDKDGRFQIAGTGADRLVSVELINARLARTHFLVVTREGFDAKAMNEAIAKTGRGAALVYGPSLDYIAEPNRLVEGTVREGHTGKPVIGATIQAMDTFVAPVISDSAGRFRMMGVRRAKQYTLSLTPPAKMSLIGRAVSFPDVPDSLEPIHAEVELPKGIIVTGRVLDRATGKGVAESQVRFAPLPHNPFATKASDELKLSTYTDGEGRFRLVTIPGPGVLLAQAFGTRLRINHAWVTPYKAAEFDPEEGKRVEITEGPFGRNLHVAPRGATTLLDPWNACKVLDLKEGGEALRCNLLMDPGLSLTLKLEDPDGKPLAGAIASGISAMPLEAIFLDSPNCPVYGLDPTKVRQLVLLHATVEALYSDPVARGLIKQQRFRSEPSRTDEKGRFRLEAIVPAFNFSLAFGKGRQRFEPEAALEIKPLQAGKMLDLGAIRVKPNQ
jgi:hypothetical protein